MEADACAKAEDVLVEELMKTADTHDIVGVKNEGDEEPTIDEAATSTEVTHTASTPTKASTHHQNQSDTPRRGEIRGEICLQFVLHAKFVR